jgi:hypothetical protein
MGAIAPPMVLLISRITIQARALENHPTFRLQPSLSNGSLVDSIIAFKVLAQLALAFFG